MGVGKMKFTYSMRTCIAGSITLFVLILICTVTPKVNAQNFRENFVDTTDNAFDLSTWLSQVYGFFPVVSHITEPATGYDAAGGFIYLSKKKEFNFEGKPVPPEISVIGEAITENSTWVGILVHQAYWKQDRIRFMGVAGYDVNRVKGIKKYVLEKESKRFSKALNTQSPYLKMLKKQSIIITTPDSEYRKSVIKTLNNFHKLVTDHCSDQEVDN